MAKRRKKGKLDFKAIAERTLITSGTGAAAHLVAEAFDLKNPEYMDYGFMAAGVILPEVVKGSAMNTAADALLAVGGYRLAQRYDLAGKLGFNTGVAGIDVPFIGAGRWTPGRSVYADPYQPEKKNTVK